MMNWFNRLSLVNKIILISTFLGVLFICFSDYLLWFDISAADKISSAVLFVTAGAIVMYTQETYELKKIQQTEFEYQNRPYFRIRWSDKAGEIFEIKNQGKGIATEITFESIVLREGPIQTPVIIKRRPSIGPDSYSLITEDEIRSSSNKDSKFNLKGYIDTKLKNDKFPEIHMVYMDLLGHVYDAKFEPDEVYNDRFKIKKQDKRPKSK